MSFALDPKSRMAATRIFTTPIVNSFSYYHHFTNLKKGDSRSYYHRLQRTIGNHAVQEIVQSNATQFNPGRVRGKQEVEVNQLGDAHEQEADRVAERVLRNPDSNDLMQVRRNDGGLSRTRSSTEISKKGREEKKTHSNIRLTLWTLPNNVLGETIGEIGNNSRLSGGVPIDTPSREFMESRFGFDLGGVRIHSDEAAAKSARSLNALAYAVGNDIVFGEGQYQPNTMKGKNLLAHELTHVIQNKNMENILHPQDGERIILQAKGPQHIIRRRPAALIDGFTFLGSSVGGGISPTLRDRLINVERHLRTQYDALGPNHPDRIFPGGDPVSFTEWAGVKSIRSWRKGSGRSFHQSGSAVDVNYDLQPYIVTRTVTAGRDGPVTTLGGENAGAGLKAQRRAAVEVYDRAVQFKGSSSNMADVGIRRPHESTHSVYVRFIRTSNALADYFGFAFRYEPTAVTRPPIANIEGVTDNDLLSAIPATELLPMADAIRSLESFMDNDQFRQSHPGWPFTPRQQYFRIIRDYEHVRIPMQRGDPSASPTNTRNPARGFLHFEPWFVEAMTDIGRLRWGIADFGTLQSGDVHHFDLGFHDLEPDGTP